MENYFNYFTEIEEHFQRRRGRIQLSPLDWALIETWKDAGIPLRRCCAGIDAAFDKYEQRPSKSQKINSLAYCAQAVLVAAEEMKEAAVGAASREMQEPSPERLSDLRNLVLSSDVMQTNSMPRSFPRQKGLMQRRWLERRQALCARLPRIWRPRKLRRDWKIWSDG